MKDIFMFCENCNCECEDKCCQECEKQDVCENRCENVRYKEKIYHSDEFLIQQLEEAAEKFDSWLIAVAAEKIRSLTGGGNK